MLFWRLINTNLGDDSSVWNVKSKAEIEARLAESVRKSDSEKMGEKSHIAYKLPDITPFLPKLKQYYPESRIVIVRRDAVGTLSSMIEKSWFSDANANANLIWPFVQYEGLKIPYWVSQDDLDKWLAMSELERCAYYYVLVNKAADDVPGHIELKYSDLLQDANGTAKQLAEQLGVSFGCRSQEVIGTIRPTEKTRDKNLFEKLTNKELKEQVEYYSVRSE